MIFSADRQLEIPYQPDSAAYFCQISHLPWPVWLDSAGRGDVDILAAAPATTLVSCGQQTTIVHAAQSQTVSGNPLQLLEQYLPEAPALEDIPFCGGAIGYFSYDLGRQFEQLPAQAAHDINLPDMQVGIYHWALVQDHRRQRSFIGWLPGQRPDPGIIARLLAGATTAPATGFSVGVFTAQLSRQHYANAFTAIQNYIHAGDCYQVNLTQRFTAPFSGSPLAAYLCLRQALPSPFSAFFQPQQGSILSLSPERFIRSHHGHVVTQPIKGTIARGKTAAEDEQLAQTLQSSSKDRAENLMIVDLLRNDLSKTCRNVTTTRLFALESYANVHHLVSTVEGQLAPTETPLSLLQKSFPGGSITGAPKIRAMEIIEELEPSRRSVYCGSLGYISSDGQMDTSIAIRTLVCADAQIHCWGGGGIVADSQVETEYEECLAKIRLLMTTLRPQD
jgi:para-aminobenzoate synthetase component 1